MVQLQFEKYVSDLVLCSP